MIWFALGLVVGFVVGFAPSAYVIHVQSKALDAQADAIKKLRMAAHVWKHVARHERQLREDEGEEWKR